MQPGPAQARFFEKRIEAFDNFISSSVSCVINVTLVIGTTT